MTRRTLFASGILATTVIACGAASSDVNAPAKTASPPEPRAEAPAPEPRTVEEAQQQIADAAAALDGRALKYSEDRDAPKTPPAEPSPGGAGKAEDRHVDSAVSRCASPCKALASMKRAVEALCRMTGETDAKCVDARKTLNDNVGKTASCKCQ